MPMGSLSCEIERSKKGVITISSPNRRVFKDVSGESDIKLVSKDEIHSDRNQMGVLIGDNFLKLRTNNNKGDIDEVNS